MTLTKQHLSLSICLGIILTFVHDLLLRKMQYVSMFFSKAILKQGVVHCNQYTNPIGKV